MSGIDWTNHEAVVRAAVPAGVATETCSGMKVFTSGEIVVGADVILLAVGKEWWDMFASARQHPTVQAYEKLHNPAFALPSAADLDAHAEEQRVREATGAVRRYTVKPEDLNAMAHCDTSAAMSSDAPEITMGMVGNLARAYAERVALPALPVAQEDANLRATLEKFVSAARSWHDFHHRSATVACDRFCELLVEGDKALACAAHMGREGR